jgi:hypothetical protein
LTDAPTQTTPLEPSRWRRHVAKYWWLWGFIVLLLSTWLFTQWEKQLTTFERQLLGIWRPMHILKNGYFVINADRTAESWRLDGEGKAHLTDEWHWKIQNGEFYARQYPANHIEGPFTWPTWQHIPIKNFDGNRVDFPTFYWERVSGLPEPFATAREKWLKQERLD